jgi:hypothetical protein
VLWHYWYSGDDCLKKGQGIIPWIVFSPDIYPSGATVLP